MNMKSFENLRENLCKELEDISNKREIDKQMLENIHLLTGSIKNIDKIIADENEKYGYSQANEPMMRTAYNEGNSYANRGKHYVRGHYSNDGWDMRGNSAIDMLRDMLTGADDREREEIKRLLREMSN